MINKYINHKITECLIIIIEVLFIFSCIIPLFEPLNEYKYAGRDLIAPNAIFLEQFMGEDRDGYYIDSSLLGESENLEEYTIAIPKVNLKKGSYEVKIRYKTGTNVNTYVVSSESNYHHTKIGHINVGLNPEKEEQMFLLESNLDIDGYTIKINFSGESYIFVDSVSIQETMSLKIKNLVKSVMLIVLVNGIRFMSRKKPDVFRRDKLVIYLLLGGFVILASQPAFAPYLYEGHDLEFHLNRIEGIKDSLLCGVFPARMHHEILGGAGYPVSVFYGDILLYFPAILRILGWSVQSAYQLYIIMVNLLTCIITFKVLKAIFKEQWIGIAGTFIYILAPYRLECIYLRAAVGEYTALCFYPIIVYALYKIYMNKENDNGDGWIYLSIGFSGLILSHVISTFSAFLLTAVFCLINFKSTLKKDVLMDLVKAVALTIGICAGFLIPFLDYMLSGIMNNDITLQSFYAGRTVTLNQLLSIFPHGTGIAYPIHEEIVAELEMTYAIGGAGIIGLILYSVVRFYFKEWDEKYKKLGDSVFGFSIFTLWMITDYFPWNEIEQFDGFIRYIMHYIQFPWRFLGIASVLMTIVIAVVLDRIKRENNAVYCGIAIALVTLAYISGNYFMTDYMNSNKKMYIAGECDVDRFALGAGDYLPQGASFGYNGLKYENEKVNVISDTWENATYYVECKNMTTEEQDIQLPIIAYENYRATDIITGEELEVGRGENYRVKVILPKEYCGKIAVEYCSPWYWRLSEVVSLISLVGLLGVIRKRKHCN